MKTISRVHSPEERMEMRQSGERRTLRCQWRLLACVTILRTGVTRLLPLAGAAGWWVTLVCLVPGLLLYWLGCWGLKRGGDCRPMVYILAAVALLADGISSMTTLITMFTQGVGALGTQVTLALVASGMLLFCLNKEGLARGIYFLRLVLLIMLAAVVSGYLLEARWDHLFPLMGDGVPSLRAAFCAGIGMGWVFLLPLLEQPVGKRRLVEPLPVVLLCGVVLLALCLWIPHEQLTMHYALGDCLVQTVQLVPMLRLVTICLWMGALFLSLGSVCSLGAGYTLAPWGRSCVWLPWVFAAVLAATQCLPVRSLWQTMAVLEPWLLMVSGVAVILLFGRKQK